MRVARYVPIFAYAGHLIDIGGIEEATWLKALVPLWVRVDAALNTWRHAFKVLRD